MKTPPLALLIAVAFLGPARGDEPALRLAIQPPEIRLGERQQVVVTGLLADGSIRDWTDSARFSVDRPDVADVSPSGVVTPRSRGEARLRVEAGGSSASVPIRFDANPEARTPSFRLDVAQVFSKSGCNMGACHGNLNGKGGFRLSLRGEDPGFDLIQLTRESLGRRVDPNRPDASLALRKPLGQLPHEGGQRLLPDSPEARTLLGWIASGATDDVATAPKLVKLSVFPTERYLAPKPSSDPSSRGSASSSRSRPSSPTARDAT